MCGILGAMFFPTERKVKNRLRAVQMVLAEAFSGSKERGKDAAGVAMVADDYYAVVKGPWDSESFMLKSKDEPLASSILECSPTRPFETFHEICRQKEADLNLIMMHTRAKTQGSEYENSNNHPILVPDESDKDAIIIGVHNGSLRNDTEIRKQLRKDGELVTSAEVDSAAIFEVVHSVLGKDEPTLERMGEVTKWLEGLMAVCVVSRHHPNKVMFWREGRPLEYIIAQDLGVVFFASEDKYVKESILRYNRGRLLFPGRLSLPEINHETKFHTDGWMVLFDTNQKLGDSTNNSYGIAKFAEEERNPKIIYTDVQAPATNTSGWTGGFRSTETKEEKSDRYLSTVSNAIEKGPITNKKDSVIEDLSPEVEQQPEGTAEDTGSGDASATGNTYNSAHVDETPEDEENVLIEGEILTKTCSDDDPEDTRMPHVEPGHTISPELGSVMTSRGGDVDHETSQDELEEDMYTVVTDDVYEAAKEDLTKAKAGESIMSSLEDVIERCRDEAQLEESDNSLDAIKDLYDHIFEEAFIRGVSWRERVGDEESIEDLEELKNKVRVMESNRDEINKLLTESLKTGTGLRNFVSTLKAILRITVDSLVSKVSYRETKRLFDDLSTDGFYGTDISNIFRPTDSGKSSTLKRIESFLCNMKEETF